MTNPRRWWGEFTAPEMENLDPENVVAILPIAAIEQHGPHLPVNTDSAIMAGMLETAIQHMPGDMEARILPIQCVGKSNEHLYQPGTLTLSAANLIDAWHQLGQGVARTGIRKLIIVTSHGGNEEIMGIVSRELRVELEMMAVKTSWMRFGTPENMYDGEEMRLGIHGGDVETSLMLHFRPELVKKDQAINFRSNRLKAEQQFKHLAQTGTHAFAWIARDLNHHGVVGDASKATAAKGQETANHQAKGFVELLKEVAGARLSTFLNTGKSID